MAPIIAELIQVIIDFRLVLHFFQKHLPSAGFFILDRFYIGYMLSIKLFLRQQYNSGIIIKLNPLSMDSNQQIDSTKKKRDISEIMPTDLLGRLSSKADFYAYLDKHRKSSSSNSSILSFCSSFLYSPVLYASTGPSQ